MFYPTSHRSHPTAWPRYEQTMRIDYLRGLNERYEEWIKTYKGHLMIVDGDTTDFQDNPQDFKRVTDMIDDRLFGLFPME